MKKWILPILMAGFLLTGCSSPAATSSALPSSTEKITETQMTEEPGTLEETETGTATETQQEPVIQTVKITATGDCTLGATQTHGYAGSFHEYYDKYGQDYFFKNVRSIFEQDDFTLINLECVLSNATERVEKTWNLKGKPEYVGIMTDSSVEGASLGNNHTFDYGQQGLDDTREVLNKAGIIFGFNDHVDTYTTKDGIKIGIVSASQLSADETHANYIRDGIAELREEGADLVIACCHWGIEGDHYPNDYQQKLAHQVIDWGADLLVGTHPHVLQGMELYNGKMICYSLGNFCFGGNSSPSDMDTMIFQQTFTITSDGVQADNVTNIIPCSISSADGYNNYQPTPATGDEATRIKSKIDERSAAIPTADSTAKSSGDTGSSDTVSADDASGSTDTSDESESDTDSDFSDESDGSDYDTSEDYDTSDEEDYSSDEEADFSDNSDE